MGGDPAFRRWARARSHPMLWEESQHPRDASGKFGEGGGEAPGAPKKLTAASRSSAKEGVHSLKEGVHFKELHAPGLSKSVSGELTKGIAHPEIAAVLEKHPLNVVTIRKNAPLLGQRAAATYMPGGKSIIIQTDHDIGDITGTDGVLGSTIERGWGKPDQQPYGVANLGKTKMERIQRVVTHEIGHHIHGGDESSPAHHAEIDDIVKHAFENGGKPSTDYAKKNREEYFAEAVAAYVHEHDAFKKADPVGYEMVKKVLAIRSK